MNRPGKPGEYAQRGDYHRELSPDWSYTPTYLRKTELVKQLLASLPRGLKILDVGSGEGVFTETLVSLGFAAVGVDKYGSSRLGLGGDVVALPFKGERFDAVLFLDVMEHLQFAEQEQALEEICRVLKPGGWLILSVPNLAHLYSRVRFFFRGKLARTASAHKHPGDRPIAEFLELIKQKGLVVLKRQGIFPTFPFLFKWMQRRPRQTLILYNFLTRVFPYPNFCFLNLLLCQAVQRKP